MSILYLIGKSNALYEAINYTIKQFPKQEVIVVPAKSDIENDNWQYSIKKLCKEKSIKTVTLEEIYNDQDAVVISIQFDLILKPELFKTDRIFNIHFSLLPKYKGVYPAIWPIINGESKSGVTLHCIDAGIDTGDIIDQIEVPISNEDTARDLYNNCIEAAVEIFKKNLQQLISGNFTTKQQPKTDSIYYSKKSIDFSNIKYNLNRTAWQIHNQLRGMNFREFQLPMMFDKKVYKSEILDVKSNGKPGSIVEEDTNSHIVINTIDHQLKIYFDWYEQLFEGCVSNNIEQVIQCLPYIDDLEVKNKNGWTALMIAAYSGNYKICETLIEKGANVNATNYKGTSVLMYAKTYASINSDLKIVELLIKNGALINQKDKKGISVLEYATKENNQLVINYLTKVLANEHY